MDNYLFYEQNFAEVVCFVYLILGLKIISRNFKWSESHDPFGLLL